MSLLSGEDTASSESLSDGNPESGPSLSMGPCDGLDTKFCRVMRAAADADDTWDVLTVASISIHESGFSGPVGFGILGPRGVYATDYSASAAVGYFLDLVQGPRYRTAWSLRADPIGFLNALVDAGYAGVEGRGWPPKVLWVRDWMLDHPSWRSD